MFIICFKTYFFPVYIYAKKAIDLTFDSPFVFVTSINIIGVIDIIKSILKINVFGIDNILLLTVILTALIDAYFGVKKSVLESKEALKNSLEHEIGSPDHKRWIKVSRIKRFQLGKLQYTFFKCFTLLGYLFFVKTLLGSDTGILETFIGYTSTMILKIPLALFWYYDFKSIGDNSAYIYGKKAFIFKVVEALFELQIKKHFEKLKK